MASSGFVDTMGGFTVHCSIMLDEPKSTKVAIHDTDHRPDPINNTPPPSNTEVIDGKITCDLPMKKGPRVYDVCLAGYDTTIRHTYIGNFVVSEEKINTPIEVPVTRNVTSRSNGWLFNTIGGTVTTVQKKVGVCQYYVEPIKLTKFVGVWQK